MSWAHRKLHLKQHHIGSNRAGQGPKHQLSMFSDEGGDNRSTAEKHNTVKTAKMRTVNPLSTKPTVAHCHNMPAKKDSLGNNTE
jgi:hypothetical protein